MVRRLSTLDHLTEGRLGWNVVTSYSQNEFKAMGLKEMVPHEERYERADEFIEVCNQLWDSWENDAIIADAETGIYADPTKVHRVEHNGKYYRCNSPSFVRFPAAAPVIWQAGQSGRGATMRPSTRKRFSQFNRPPKPCAPTPTTCAPERSLKVAAQTTSRSVSHYRWWSTKVVVPPRKNLSKLKSKIPVDASLAIMSGHIGYDFSQLALDEYVGQIHVEGIRGLLKSVLATYDGAPVTLREAANFYGISLGAPVAVGNPADVADFMEELLDAGHGDGFNVMATYVPGCYQEFVDFVVPELQRRGRFRQEYSGSTLRHHLSEY